MEPTTHGTINFPITTNNNHNNKNIFNKNYLIVLIGSLLTLFTSGGVFHNYLSNQLDNNTALDNSICNSFPIQEINKTLGVSSDLNIDSMEMTTETIFIYMFIIVLPMCPFVPLISTSSLSSFLSTSSATTQDLFIIKPLLAETIFTHMLGQASAFASTEALQYFIVYPNQLFIDNCGVKSKEECETKFETNKNLYISQICNNALAHDNNQSLLSNSVHSLPQLTSVMLGASLVMFFYCYRQAANLQLDKTFTKFTILENASIKNKLYIILNTKSCRLIMLFVLALMFGLCLHYLTNNSAIQWTDIMYSFFSGILLQCVFIYILKSKNNKNSPNTSLQSDVTIPLKEYTPPPPPPNTPQNIIKNIVFP